MRRATLVVVALLVAAPGAYAQAIRGFGDAGLDVFTATKTFKAVLGKSDAPVVGGGLQFGLPNRIFLSIGASRVHRTGHRVFVFENQVYTLNEPAIITMTPLDFTAGYRFRSRGLVPYAGGGAGLLKYRETSPHEVAGDEVNISRASYHALVGAEVPMSRWLAAAVEGQWSAVPNAIGSEPTSVAGVYDEHDLGGFTLRVKVLVGR